LTIRHLDEEPERIWRKASRSNAGNDCIEIARTPVGYLIRDSKNSAGPRLWVDLPTWAALIDDVKAGRYQRLTISG
jgi:hypothetical protein